MVRPDLITAKLSEIEHRVLRIRVHCPATADALEANQDALDLVAFNLMLAVQSCVDVASHLIADQSWRPAVTLGETFERLGEHGVIRPDTAVALRQAAGLRNVVAHGYAGVNAAAVFAAATKGTLELDHFSQEVAAWLVGKP